MVSDDTIAYINRGLCEGDTRKAVAENNTMAAAMADEGRWNRHAQDQLSEMARQRLEDCDIYIAASTEHRATIRRIIMSAQQTSWMRVHHGQGIEEMRLYQAAFDHEMHRYAVQNRAHQATIRHFLFASEQFFRGFLWHRMPLGVRQAYEHEVAAQGAFVHTLAQRYRTDSQLEWPFPVE